MERPQPQAAIDAGLMTREQAAAYLGMSLARFNAVAAAWPSVRLGRRKYFDPAALRARVQQLAQDRG